MRLLGQTIVLRMAKRNWVRVNFSTVPVISDALASVSKGLAAESISGGIISYFVLGSATT